MEASSHVLDYLNDEKTAKLHQVFKERLLRFTAKPKGPLSFFKKVIR